MAEGWARHLKGDQFDVCSAGTNPQGLNPNAVKVMAEAGVDISQHTSKSLADVGQESLDVVVTVCGHANENCPVLHGNTRVVHCGFDDPPKLAENASSDEEALDHYRRVRDEIRDWVSTLPAAIQA